jgi:hypothetical protein
MNFGENSGTSASGEIGRSYGSLPTLELVLALEKYRSRVITGHIGFLDPDHIQSTCTDMEALLKTRCGGLLEVHCRSLNSEISPASSVEYLHLTVRDFFYKPETRKILEERSPTGFDPNIVLLKSCILQCKALFDSNQAYVISRRSITDRALILRVIFEAEFYEFHEQIGPRIRRILSFRIRGAQPLIRQFRGFCWSDSRISRI